MGLVGPITPRLEMLEPGELRDSGDESLLKIITYPEVLGELLKEKTCLIWTNELQEVQSHSLFDKV